MSLIILEKGTEKIKFIRYQLILCYWINLIKNRVSNKYYFIFILFTVDSWDIQITVETLLKVRIGDQKLPICQIINVSPLKLTIACFRNVNIWGAKPCLKFSIQFFTGDYFPKIYTEITCFITILCISKCLKSK